MEQRLEETMDMGPKILFDEMDNIFLSRLGSKEGELILLEKMQNVF
jgi:hypothetical protein